MKHRPFFFRFASLLALAFTALSAIAQQGPPVKSIEIQYAGPATISRERILANMRTAVGKPYSEFNVEEDIRNLYATGNINNVRIFGEPTSDGQIRVIVVVQPKPIISDITVEGASPRLERRIRREISAKVNDPLNEASLEADRQKILTFYQDRNFPDATVLVRTQVDEGAGKARVQFTISEGGKSVIGRVSFSGVSALSEKDLRKAVKTKKRGLLSFITKTGRVQSEMLDADTAAVRELYQNAGYIDAGVEAEVVPFRDASVEVVFRVTEGPQYSVGTVDLDGAVAFTRDEVLQQIQLAPGGVFSPKAVRDDAKRISDMYGTRGYVDMQLIPETTSAGATTVNVIYRIDEGDQSYVERVNISGNTRTKDKVLRREMAVSPGDVYNTVLVDASRQRLQGLDYFERVETYPSETLIPGRKDLNVVVEEKRTGSFNFGVGFSSIDSLLGFVELQQRNFDVTNPWAFTGGGQRFRMRIQAGLERRDFILSLTEPYFLDYKFSLGGEAFYREATFVSDVYSESNFGIEFTARKPIGKFGTLRFGYRIENISIQDVDEDASDAIKAEEGDYLRSALSAAYIFDRRDSVFLTRKGERFEFGTYLAGGILGGDVELYGIDISAAKFFLLPYDTILQINGQIAVVDALSGTVPIFDRLFLGGANNLRGFAYRDVAPLDENGEPLGGNTLARVTIEYTFPVVDRIRGAIFYDGGFVNSGAYDFSPSDFASDVGIGVRLDLPIGPVRLDYGFPVTGDNGSGGRFNFNVGYQFF